MEDVLYEVRCLKSNEDMIVGLIENADRKIHFNNG